MIVAMAGRPCGSQPPFDGKGGAIRRRRSGDPAHNAPMMGMAKAPSDGSRQRGREAASDVGDVLMWSGGSELGLR